MGGWVGGGWESAWMACKCMQHANACTWMDIRGRACVGMHGHTYACQGTHMHAFMHAS